MANEKIIEIIKDAFELEGKGQFKNAIELLYQGLNVEPDSVEILAQIASLYLKLKNYEIASEYAQKAIETPTGSIFAQNVLLNVYIETADKEKFAKYIQTLNLNEIPQELLNTIVTGFIKFNLYNEALNLCKNTINKEIFDAKTLYYFAFCYYCTKNYTEAKKYAELSMKKNPNNIDNNILIADIAYKDSDFQKVYDILNKLDKDTMPPHAFYLLGLIYLNNKQYEPAVQCFSKAVEKDNKNKDYFYYLANAYYFLGWFDEAIKSINRAKTLAPDDIEILYLNAEINFWQNKFENALQLISSILLKAPQNIPAKLLTTSIYLKKGLFELARCELLSILNEDAENLSALKLYCQACLELNMKESALTTIEKILLLEPNNIDYMCKLTEIFCELNRWEDAKISLNKIFEFSKNYETAYDLAIKINFYLKDYEKAEQYAQKWLNINPNSHYAHYILSQIYIQTSASKALEEIKEALTLEPKDGNYYLFAGQIYETYFDIRDSYKYYCEAFEILKTKNVALKLLNVAIKTNESNMVENTFNKVKKIAPHDLDITFAYTDFMRSTGATQKAVNILKSLQKSLYDKDLKAIVKNKINEIKLK